MKSCMFVHAGVLMQSILWYYVNTLRAFPFTATHAIQNISISFADSGGVCFEALFAVGSAAHTNGCHVLLTGKESKEFVIDIQIGIHCMTSLLAGNYTVIGTDILPNGSLYKKPALTTTFESIGRITHSVSSGTHVRYTYTVTSTMIKKCYNTAIAYMIVLGIIKRKKHLIYSFMICCI